MREMDAAPTPMKKGGKACYAGGGSVSDTESGMQSKGSYGSGSNSDSDRALQAKEDARAAKSLRDQDRGYKEHYKREEAENRADRKAVQDALMYIPRKIGQGAQSAYDAVMGKKSGGSVKKGVPVHNRTPKC